MVTLGYEPFQRARARILHKSMRADRPLFPTRLHRTCFRKQLQ